MDITIYHTSYFLSQNDTQWVSILSLHFLQMSLPDRILSEGGLCESLGTANPDPSTAHKLKLLYSIFCLFFKQASLPCPQQHTVCYWSTRVVELICNEQRYPDSCISIRTWICCWIVSLVTFLQCPAAATLHDERIKNIGLFNSLAALVCVIEHWYMDDVIYRLLPRMVGQCTSLNRRHCWTVTVLM